MADTGAAIGRVATMGASGAAAGAAAGPWGAVIGAGVGIVVGTVSELMAAGKEDEANALLNEAYKRFDALEIPKLEKALAQTVPPSEMSKIKVDPALKGMQMRALGKLQEVGEDPDLTLEDQQRVNQVLAKTNRATQANNNRVLEGMAGRGQLNSGAALAAQLQNNQAGAEQANAQGMDIAAAAQGRALQALMSGGELAGRIRGQEFGEQSAQAQAQDAIAKYNAGAQERAYGYNNQNAQWTYGQQRNQAADQLAIAESRAGKKKDEAAQTRENMGSAMNTAGQVYGQGFGKAGAGGAGGAPTIGTSQAALASSAPKPAPAPAAPIQASAPIKGPYAAELGYGYDEDSYIGGAAGSPTPWDPRSWKY